MIDWRQKLLEQKPAAVVVRNARLADTEDAAKVKESPLERLQGAIVDNEKAEQEGNNAFDGNLYLYYALRQLSTPEKALQYCADIDASIQDQHETARTSEQDPLLEMEVLSARSSNSSKASKRMGRSTARAAIYRNVMRSLDLGSPFASILKASMRWMTPFLQVIAPLTIISKAYSNIVSNKKMWIDKCGGVEDFCRYMQEYRLNMIFDPSVANEAPGQCQLGEASLFSMNKFFLFNPYSDAQSYMWMTKLLCCVFVYGVGVRISVDLSNDHRNRQKAILVSRYFLQKLESIALGRRESKRPYTFTDFCICASGFIRMTIAVLMLIAMASILWLTNNPTDVVLDALGLVFIYSLDSVGSEFGLLSSRDWNVDWMGQLYSMVVEPKITTEIVKLEKEVVVGIMNSERSRKSKKRSILGRLRSSPSIDTASQYATNGDVPELANGDLHVNIPTGGEHMDTNSVKLRNLAEERVLFVNESLTSPRIDDTFACFYVLLLFVIIVLFVCVSPPSITPLSDRVVNGNMVYKCLVHGNGAVIYSDAIFFNR